MGIGSAPRAPHARPYYNREIATPRYPRDVRRAGLVLLVLLLLVWTPTPFTRTATALTPVSGVLPGNTTWSLTGSPYLVTSDVTVPGGVTLTVESGVQVRFDTAPPASHSILVLGTLVSVGRQGLNVLFTSNDSFPDRNDWVSIILQGSSASVIEHTTLIWGSTALDVRQSSPRIANNTILESGLRAIQVIGPNAAPVIEGNFIQTELLNQRTGIITQEADPVIRDNFLQDNYFGIFVYLGGSPRIENNTIRNGWRGVLVVSADPVLVNNTIEGNGLPDLGGSGILLFDSAATLIDNTIRDNGVGVDIPYSAKETLARSRGNTVNGVPLETMYRYRARDAVVAPLDLDSGHRAGYTGNASQQGLLTCYDCVNVTFREPRLRNNEVLVWASNSSVLVANATLANATRDFYLEDISQVAALNTTVRTDRVNITDERSSLTVRNFLDVRAETETGDPLPGTRVRVEQDGVTIGDRATGPDGWTRWFVAAYGVLGLAGQSLFFTPSAVTASVTSPGRTFQDSPRTVDMSRSHAEVFRLADRTAPWVLSTVPENDAVGVRLGSRITIFFTEAMNRTTTEAAIVVVGFAAEDFVWEDASTLSFRIRDPRYGATVYVEVLDTATDLAGNPLADTHLFTFDLERAPRQVNLVPIWGTSAAILAAGLLAVLWRRSRSRAQAPRQEEGDPGEDGEA